MPARVERGERRRRSASSCAPVYGSSGSSATAKCVHTPSSTQRRTGRDALGERDGVGRAAPDAVHPGVDLEVHGDGVAPAVGRRRQRVDGARRVHGRRRGRAATSLGAWSAGGSESSRIGRVDPGLRAAPTPSSTSATPSPSAPASSAAARHRRPRRGRSRRPSRRPTPRPAPTARAARPTLWRDGVEVDLGPRRPRRGAASLRRRRLLERRRGDEVEQVAGDEADGAARGGRGRPWSQAAAAAASSGATRWASSAPTMPGEHVAGAGGGQPGVAAGRRRAPRPRASATTVAGPLSRTTAPELGGQAARGGEAVGAGRACRRAARTRRRGASAPSAAAAVAGRHRRRRRPTPARRARRRRPRPASVPRATTSTRAHGVTSVAARAPARRRGRGTGARSSRTVGRPSAGGRAGRTTSVGLRGSSATPGVDSRT